MGSIEKLTSRSSVALMTKPPSMRGHSRLLQEDRAAVEPGLDDEVRRDGDEEGVVRERPVLGLDLPRRCDHTILGPVVVAQQHARPEVVEQLRRLGLGVAHEVAVCRELGGRLLEGVEEFDERARALRAQRLPVLRVAAVGGGRAAALEHLVAAPPAPTPQARRRALAVLGALLVHVNDLGSQAAAE
eukprot:CAMPEP_0185426168 /NCGR_PEP_ID=MMETSP1365-20130426/14470_1 /TAXON_ID=38817 /ORGANISM="Gephyrocapsa oceanica, Strain RCC1303" /LENGTH=186 /DNA_ID=CAMNT_0028030193 /DNA_START=239 /DNA_END=798 /DNA_ORIENTATION=-